jgi:probable HAF family extracellular repeat protein
VGFQALGAQFDNSVAYDVNEDGYIAGMAGNIGEEHAVIWRPDGSVIDLGTLDGAWAHALAINDGKVIVGAGETINIDVHAFDWAPGDTSLNDLGPSYYKARDVANTGRMVGDLRGSPDAFTLRSGITTKLPRFTGGAVAEGVNTCGTVVGFSWAAGGKPVAVRWVQDGSVCDSFQ